MVFTDEECGSLKVVVDGGELTTNINQKKKSDVLQAYSQLFCHRCVYNLKERKVFSSQINRSCFDLILGMWGKNYCTMDMENLSCLDSIVNKTF